MKIMFMLGFDVSIINSNVHILSKLFSSCNKKKDFTWWALEFAHVFVLKTKTHHLFLSILLLHLLWIYCLSSYTYITSHYKSLTKKRVENVKQNVHQPKTKLIFFWEQENSVLSGMGFLATCFDVSIFKISVLFCMILPNNKLGWLTVL